MMIYYHSTCFTDITKAPFPSAFKFKFPVPLVDIVIGLFGIEASNSGKND